MQKNKKNKSINEGYQPKHKNYSERSQGKKEVDIRSGYQPVKASTSDLPKGGSRIKKPKK